MNQDQNLFLIAMVILYVAADWLLSYFTDRRFKKKIEELREDFVEKTRKHADSMAQRIDAVDAKIKPILELIHANAKLSTAVAKSLNDLKINGGCPRCGGHIRTRVAFTQNTFDCRSCGERFEVVEGMSKSVQTEARDSSGHWPDVVLDPLAEQLRKAATNFPVDPESQRRSFSNGNFPTDKNLPK